MGTTFSGKHTTPITLTPTDNPAVFDGTFDLELATGGIACVLGPAGTNWNITVQAGARIVASASNSDSMALGQIGDTCTLTNAGTIQGGYAGVYIPGKNADVTNTGTISSTGYVGVKMGEKARVTNGAGGIVSAKQQAVILRDTCTLTNAGTLKTTGKECVLGEGPDSILNNSGMIEGAVVFTRHAAITNTGTITGPITNPKA